MGTDSLLTLIQDVTNELGLAAPQQIFGNQDRQVVQLLALANKEGRVCSKEAGSTGGWSQLRQEWVFPTIIGQATYPLPADFAFFIPETGWDRSYMWRLGSPMQAAEWQLAQSGLYPLAPYERFRIMDGELWLTPTPTEVDTLAFEYISTHWCQSAAGVTQNRWMADTDTYLLPEDLMRMGIKWRYLAAKGLDYSAEYQEYGIEKARAIANVAALEAIPLNGRLLRNVHLISDWQVPETGYGV